MRNGMNAAFIYTENFVGINLGADYVSEHEWGIKGIKRYLGIKEDAAFGLPRRQVNETHNLHWYETDKLIGIVCYRFYENEIKNWKPRELYHSDKAKSFYSGWSQDGFYILTDNLKKNAKVIERIKKVYEALNVGDACVWLGGGGVFENSGLCIGIVDQMSKDIFQGWFDVDKKHDDTRKAFEATGIEKFLKDHGKSWFALSPTMNDGKLTVWLNPCEQHKYNAGSFTIDQLRAWAVNKGPVIKTSKNDY